MSTNNSDNENENDEEIESDENPIEDEDLNDVEIEKVSAAVAIEKDMEKDIDGISKDNWKLLDKVKTTQLQDHLKGVSFGSPTTNDRLMKELKDIFKSQHYKNGKLLI